MEMRTQVVAVTSLSKQLLQFATDRTVPMLNELFAATKRLTEQNILQDRFVSRETRTPGNLGQGRSGIPVTLRESRK
jgi:hypothetical protein